MAVIKIVPMPGAEGQRGEQGATGPQGPQGNPGAQGPAGADAVWYYNGEYNPGASYVVGDVVTYDGQLWYRKNSNGGNVGDTPSEGLFWDLLAAKGADFNTGNGLVVTGIIDDPVINPAGTMSLSVQDGYSAFMDTVSQSAVFNGDVQITNLSGTRNTTIETPTIINNDLTVTNDATINELTVGKGLGDNEYNTVLGENALESNTTGFANTAIGKRSLRENTEGRWNTAVGSHTLRSNTIGDSNTAVGDACLENNLTGHNNVAIGNYNQVFSTGAVCNTSVGSQSLTNNVSGIHNTSVGQASMRENTTGDRNVSIGADSLYNNNGSYNTAVGNASLGSSTSSNYNTAVGHAALLNNNGAANTALGIEAGALNINGERNIFIGYQSGRNETGSDKLYIDVNDTSTPLIYGDFAADTLVVNGTLYSGGTSADDEVVTFGDLTSAVGVGNNGEVTRWSPNFKATGLVFTGTNSTYPTYNSHYVKNGRMVSFWIEVDLATVTNFGTGQYIAELPFMPLTGTMNHFQAWANVDPAINPDIAGHVVLQADHLANTKDLDLHYLKQAGGANSPLMEAMFKQGTPATLTTSSKIYINGTYITAE
jgi:hypothetical protein